MGAWLPPLSAGQDGKLTRIGAVLQPLIPRGKSAPEPSDQGRSAVSSSHSAIQ